MTRPIGGHYGKRLCKVKFPIVAGVTPQMLPSGQNGRTQFDLQGLSERIFRISAICACVYFVRGYCACIRLLFSIMAFRSSSVLQVTKSSTRKSKTSIGFPRTVCAVHMVGVFMISNLSLLVIHTSAFRNLSMRSISSGDRWTRGGCALIRSLFLSVRMRS